VLIKDKEKHLNKLSTYIHPVTNISFCRTHKLSSSQERETMLCNYLWTMACITRKNDVFSNQDWLQALLSLYADWRNTFGIQKLIFKPHARMTITYINLTWPHTRNLFFRFQYFRQSFISRTHVPHSALCVRAAIRQRQILHDPKAKALYSCRSHWRIFGVAANTWSIIHPSSHSFLQARAQIYTPLDYYTRSLWFAHI